MKLTHKVCRISASYEIVWITQRLYGITNFGVSPSAGDIPYGEEAMASISSGRSRRTNRPTYLVSADAGFVTGQVISVNGGSSMG